MIVKIKWPDGYMLIDMSKFFPTTQERARKLFKVMRLDYATDFEPVRRWLEEQQQLALMRVSDLKAMADIFKDKWFENNYWYGDCVANEKKYSQMQKEIAKKEKEAKQYQSYISLFDKIVRL